MITRHKLDNNVRVTLNASITTGSTEIIVNKASPPFRDPPLPVIQSDGAAGSITLMDSLAALTKAEIVLYTTWLDNGDGTITLGGLTRGYENTVVSAFSAGQYAVQTVTAGELNSPLLTLDHSTGTVIMPGGVDGTYPALKVGETFSAGIRVVYSGGVQNMLDCALGEHDNTQRLVSLCNLGGDFAISFPRPAFPGEDKFAFRMTYENYPTYDRPVVVIAETEINRIEMHKATRWWPDAEGSLASNTTIDWGPNDIRRVALASNAVLDFIDSSDYAVPGGGYRKLTLFIDMANVTNPGFTVTLPSSVKLPTGVAAPTFNTGQNQIRQLDFLYDGTWFLYQGMRTFQL